MTKRFLAYDLAIQLHRSVGPMKMKHHLKNQLERASLSVVLNLAEGAAKPTMPDKRRFYAIAFGSAKEVKAIFDVLELTDAATLDLADHIAACLYKLTYRG